MGQNFGVFRSQPAKKRRVWEAKRDFNQWCSGCKREWMHVILDTLQEVHGFLCWAVWSPIYIHVYAKKNYTPLDPKQFFHIHCSICVHVCGFSSYWCWQCLVHGRWEQHESQETFFHLIAIWGVCWCNCWDNNKTQWEKRTGIRANHKWNRDETRTGHRH